MSADFRIRTNISQSPHAITLESDLVSFARQRAGKLTITHLMRYWLMKSEPGEFGISDLKRNKVACWDGVRNYQARNMLRDDMKKGDLAFLYHSNCSAIGIAGIITIVREGYPDHTAFDPNSKHYDAHSNPTKPRWCMVDVRYTREFTRILV